MDYHLMTLVMETHVQQFHTTLLYLKMIENVNDGRRLI